ncbi:MAG: nucleotidyl transferase AbiEii/AbiGii toxin family protein [Phycisphaerae bacterium]|nr:nucleotidyl transferase AbiEii/AbiGii toxin family protein [Phycisphaerae bacterium]
MIPQAYITAWRSEAPWASDAQVEQDLVLSRAIVELFSNDDLGDQFALRGGTALNKLVLRPASRYSEDIDLVQMRPGAIGSMIDGIRAKLDPLLGDPRRGHSQGNTTLLYRFESEIPPVTPLRLKIEINTREHFTVNGFKHVTFSLTNGWFTGQADVVTYTIEELLGTKLRALYQRRKGRDLFDLWLCLDRGMADPNKVVACFARYMQKEGNTVSRAEFEANLYAKRDDAAFLNDTAPLITPDTLYDAEVAFQAVLTRLVSRLPGDPWRGERR